MLVSCVIRSMAGSVWLDLTNPYTCGDSRQLRFLLQR
jgi:hypothetical protein